MFCRTSVFSLRYRFSGHRHQVPAQHIVTASGRRFEHGGGNTKLNTLKYNLGPIIRPRKVVRYQTIPFRQGLVETRRYPGVEGVEPHRIVSESPDGGLLVYANGRQKSGLLNWSVAAS